MVLTVTRSEKHLVEQQRSRDLLSDTEAVTKAVTEASGSPKLNFFVSFNLSPIFCNVLNLQSNLFILGVEMNAEDNLSLPLKRGHAKDLFQ